MCTREYAHLTLAEANPKIDELLELEILLAWMQITLAEVFFGDGTPRKYHKILEGNSHRQALTAKLQYQLREAKERLITHPNLSVEILDLAEKHVQKTLRETMTQNEKLFFDIAVDQAYSYYEDQAIAFEIIMTIARTGKSQKFR
ncbi:hypothetical protein [Comamonas testosteroni]|uniref:hypothetical protein n=1 Tax=Comamonas testosteroni TaxID=285 RepID=UPI00391A4E3E